MAIGTAAMLAIAGISALTSLLATGHNAASARASREFSAQEAQKNRDFQEEMSNTAVQRRMEDLRAAGLNPALAATDGASVPIGATGSSAQSRFDSSGITSGLSNLSSLLKSNSEHPDIEEPKPSELELFQDYTSAYRAFRSAEASVFKYGDKESIEYFKSAKYLMNSARKKL